jgi:hypothetical protein
MSIIIEEVQITPNPLPSGGGHAKAICRLSSDSPIETVTAYPPEGPSVSFVAQEDGTYVASSQTPGDIPAGVYDVVIVARDSQGNFARKTIAVSVV